MSVLPTTGTLAPDFTLPRDGGSSISLADFRGRKLVLYFYPRADTPGCTREAQAFSTLAPRFAQAGTAILGVSADPVKAQDAFKAKYDLSIALASDETHRIARGLWRVGGKIDVWQEVHGRGARYFPDRSRRPHCQGVAQREGRRSCRGGVGGGSGPVAGVPVTVISI